MGLGALFQLVLVLTALVVVSGLPAPKGVAGVLVRDWSRDLSRPPRARLRRPGRGQREHLRRAPADPAGLVLPEPIDLAPVLEHAERVLELDAGQDFVNSLEPPSSR